jgi:hypothetical protein
VQKIQITMWDLNTDVFHVGKQKVDKHGSGKSESSKTPNTSQKLKQQSVGAGFNGVSTTPGTGEQQSEQIPQSVF